MGRRHPRRRGHRHQQDGLEAVRQEGGSAGGRLAAAHRGLRAAARADTTVQSEQRHLQHGGRGSRGARAFRARVLAEGPSRGAAEDFAAAGVLSADTGGVQSARDGRWRLDEVADQGRAHQPAGADPRVRRPVAIAGFCVRPRTRSTRKINRKKTRAPPILVSGDARLADGRGAKEDAMIAILIASLAVSGSVLILAFAWGRIRGFPTAASMPAGVSKVAHFAGGPFAISIAIHLAIILALIIAVHKSRAREQIYVSLLAGSLRPLEETEPI